MVNERQRIGGSVAVALVKDKEPVFDEETGTLICGEELGRPGLICKGTPIAPRWRCRRHGGTWKATEKGLALAKDSASIYDPQRLWKGYENIRRELTAFPEFIEQLYTTDLGEELAVARIVLAELLKKKDNNNKGSKDSKGSNNNSLDRELILQSLKVISRIAKDAKLIREKESNVIKQEFMDGIIAAITHAFTRCNGYQSPSDRARVFMSEFAALLPGNPAPDLDASNIIEAEKVN
ncbi:hypothetical protein LCGC14_0442550 [marine sediment metagenome]|uniref:Uncharacterized protein n=1 Tax=marine sediment metagenome TaxID=412755 RepID=A0A0F9SJZ5_9ZZZZ